MHADHPSYLPARPRRILLAGYLDYLVFSTVLAIAGVVFIWFGLVFVYAVRQRNHRSQR